MVRGLSIFLLLTACASAQETALLLQCVERNDRVCAARLLSHATSKTPEFLAVASQAYVLLGDRARAVQAIGAAVAQRPGEFDLLMDQGWVYQKCGDQVLAIQSFLMASKAGKPTPLLFYQLGLSFFLLHEFDRAAVHFHHAIELNPSDSKAEFMLGVLEVLKGALPDAKSYFERALSIEPENSHYLLHYGVLLMRMNDTDAALELMQKAEKLDSANPLTHFNLGRLYRDSGKLDDAELELREAIRLRSDLASAHYALASIYRRQGRQKDSLREFAQFTKTRHPADDGDPIDASLNQ